MDILAETRIDRKNFVQKSAGYNLCLSGRKETYKKEVKSGICYQTPLFSNFEGLPWGHSERSMSVKLPGWKLPLCNPHQCICTNYEFMR